MSFRSLMNSKVDVKSVTRTADEFGSWSEVSDVRYAAMPARIQPLSGSQKFIYNSERVEATHVLFCPGEFDSIVSTDVIVVVEARTGVGRRFDIELVRDIDLMKHHNEIAVREIIPVI